MTRKRYAVSRHRLAARVLYEALELNELLRSLDNDRASPEFRRRLSAVVYALANSITRDIVQERGRQRSHVTGAQARNMKGG